MDPRIISGMLSNDHRLRVFAAVVLGASTLDKIGSTTNLDDNTIKRSLGQLIESGLIEKKDDTGYKLCTEALRNATASTDNSTGSDLAKVGRYFKDGRLTSWPRAHKNRLLVLEHIANMFDLNTRYAESKVNEKLGKVHPDFALTRRYLIDEGFLSRASQQTGDGLTLIIYWRVLQR